jgi:hypothetical protein
VEEPSGTRSLGSGHGAQDKVRTGSFVPAFQREWRGGQPPPGSADAGSMNVPVHLWELSGAM